MDEYSSLVLSNPQLSIDQLWREHLAAETNPPGYYLLLHEVLKLGLQPRTSFVLLNVSVIAAFLAAGAAFLYRSGLRSFSLLATAVTLLGAPLLSYAPEGRVYGIAMSVCYAVTAFGLATIRKPPSTAALVGGLLIAAAAADLHIFGFIYVCAFGGAMTLVGLQLRTARISLVGVGLVLATGLSFAIYLAFGLGAYLHSAPSWWATFDKSSIISTLWWVKTYVLKWTPLLVLFPIAVGLGLWTAGSRPAVILLFLTATVFVVGPYLISFKVPIFIARYLLVGVPSLILLVLFIGRQSLEAAVDDGRRIKPTAIVCFAVACLIGVATVVNGYPAAMTATLNKPTWAGRFLVLKDAAVCRNQTIRVMGGPLDTFVEAVKPQTFRFDYVRFDPPDAVAALRAPASACPVLAWGEHILVRNGDMTMLSDADIIRRAGVAAGPGQSLTVIRHVGGFVIVRGAGRP